MPVHCKHMRLILVLSTVAQLDFRPIREAGGYQQPRALDASLRRRICVETENASPIWKSNATQELQSRGGRLSGAELREPVARQHAVVVIGILARDLAVISECGARIVRALR